MAIDIYIVTEDLNTILSVLGYIESDDDFFYFQNKAYELKLTFTANIDAFGDTIINKLQLDPLELEIHELRKYPKVAQSILNTLQDAIDAARISESKYIKFMGD